MKMEHKDRPKQNSSMGAGEKELLPEYISNVYNQFEDRLSQISVLRQLSAVLLHISDFKQVCQIIMEITIKNTVARNCSIMLMDYERGRLFLIAATNPEGESYSIDAEKIFSKEGLEYTFAAGEGAAGKAVVSKEPVLVKDVKQPSIYPRKKPA